MDENKSKNLVKFLLNGKYLIELRGGKRRGRNNFSQKGLAL